MTFQKSRGLSLTSALQQSGGTVTIAAAPLLPKASRSHLQESLFAWLEPKLEPSADPKGLPEPAEILELAVESQTERQPKPEPTPVLSTSEEKTDLSHIWVVAAEIEVTPKVASLADYRGSFRTAEGQRVDALEVYCKGCRRPYDEARGEDCAAKIDNTHLIGGDQTKRAKRKAPTPPPNARIISGGTINRRGIGAYMSGVSRPPR
ncbi:hypothetical protein [Streptomyces chartreusis]|uniref:hypothetical protein n=1 Tax=Streptomyces chartreusis TaxID=1969 RepID=UPI003663B3D3